MNGGTVREEQNFSRSPHSFNGGGAVGLNSWLAYHACVPYARLTVSNERIVLLMPWRKYSLDKPNIQSIKCVRRRFFSYLQIKHSQTECPVWMAFWPRSRDALNRLCTILENAGYNLIYEGKK